MADENAYLWLNSYIVREEEMRKQGDKREKTPTDEALIGKRVIQKKHGEGIIVGFLDEGYSRRIIIAYGDGKRVYKYPDCFYKLKYQFSDLREINELLNDLVYITYPDKKLHTYNTLLVCRNCKKSFVYTKEQQIKDHEKSRMKAPDLCKNCLKNIRDRKKTEMSFREIQELMYNPKPKDSKKRWYVHDTDGMHL